MKKLLLIRHAKATHDTGYEDLERPLKYEGLQDAAVMAARLHKAGIKPQVLVASPAIRTLATANVIAEHLSLPEPHLEKNIYDASQQTLQHIINTLPNDHEFIGLVGHNPGISQVLYFLTKQVKDVDPGAIALISFGVDNWEDITESTGKLEWFSSPKY